MSDQIDRVKATLREVFTTEAAIAQWLETPDPALGMEAPLALMTTEAGCVRVERRVRAMVHGIPL